MQIEELERLHEAATPGPWEVDTIKSEGEYGSGPDTLTGFAVSVILDPNGKALADALNSDLIVVHEDGGDWDGYVAAWDETSANDFALIVALRNALPEIIATYRERDSYKAALERIDGMTDIEADFDGFEACKIARTALERRGSE